MYVSPTLWVLFLFLLGLFLLPVNPKTIPQTSLSFSLSHSFIYLCKFQLCILLSIIPEWESPWNQRRMCNMSKWAIHPWWLLECHKRRNVPKRVLHNSNSGNCALSKDSPSFQQPIHLLKTYLSGAITSSAVLTSAKH